jgi:hypothetical protein
VVLTRQIVVLTLQLLSHCSRYWAIRAFLVQQSGKPSVLPRVARHVADDPRFDNVAIGFHRVPFKLRVRADSLLALVRSAPNVSDLEVLEQLGVVLQPFAPAASPSAAGVDRASQLV